MLQQTWQKVSQRRGRKSAFSLVEVVLALLIFGIGILSVLALFPAGLLLSNRAHADTYIAEFAEMALNSLGTELELNQAFWDVDDTVFGVLVSTSRLETAVPAIGTPWSTPPALRMGNPYYTNQYRLDAKTNILDRSLRYQLTLERTPLMMAELNGPVKRVMASTNTRYWTVHYCVSPEHVAGMNEQIIKANLRILPGLYGTADERYFFRYYFDYKNRKQLK
jgi:Tfp pilus assembly protein PilV